MWLATFILLICIVSHSHSLFQHLETSLASDDYSHSFDTFGERFGYGHDHHKSHGYGHHEHYDEYVYH